MRPRASSRNDEYEWDFCAGWKRGRRPKNATQRKQRASMLHHCEPQALADLYVQVPEVLRFDENDNVDPVGEDQDSLVTIDMVSDAEIIDAFEKVDNSKSDFSFESILNLGALPHASQEVVFQIPSPSTLNALPSFVAAPTPKPRFSTVTELPSPEKVAFSIPLKSSTFEFRPWRPNYECTDSFMDIPICQSEVFGRINNYLATKPKKPEMRKSRMQAREARQTTLGGFRRRRPVICKPEVSKPEVSGPPPTPRLSPVHTKVVVPALRMPARAQDVVFNRMLVCAA